jgi:sterol desaturase/sphingolipid hydroxylase (fatty acid hydroxylase superfamily)
MSDLAAARAALPNWIDRAVPLMLVLVFLEAIALRKGWLRPVYAGRPPKREPKGGKNAPRNVAEVWRLTAALANLCTGIVQETLHRCFVNGLLIFPYLFVHYRFALGDARDYAPLWGVHVAVFCLTDFAYYWFHRWGHECNLGWMAHVVHHSSEDYNLTTALRQGAAQYWLGWLFYLPLALFVDPSTYVLHQQFNRLYQFWIHTETIDRMGWLEHVFVTPSHHRVHHSVQPQYIDKNYGGTLIIWDKLLGTFEPEEEMCVYGLTENLRTFSPLEANLQYPKEMLEVARTVVNTSGPLAALQVIWRGPTWTWLHNPSKQKKFADQGQRDLAALPKFEREVQPEMSALAFANVLFAAAIMKCLSMFRMPDTLFWLCVAAIFASVLTTGRILDGERRLSVEVARLVILALCMWAAAESRN